MTGLFAITGSVQLMASGDVTFDVPKDPKYCPSYSIIYNDQTKTLSLEIDKNPLTATLGHGAKVSLANLTTFPITLSTNKLKDAVTSILNPGEISSGSKGSASSADAGKNPLGTTLHHKNGTKNSYKITQANSTSPFVLTANRNDKKKYINYTTGSIKVILSYGNDGKYTTTKTVGDISTISQETKTIKAGESYTAPNQVMCVTVLPA